MKHKTDANDEEFQFLLNAARCTAGQKMMEFGLAKRTIPADPQLLLRLASRADIDLIVRFSATPIFAGLFLALCCKAANVEGDNTSFEIGHAALCRLRKAHALDKTGERVFLAAWRAVLQHAKFSTRLLNVVDASLDFEKLSKVATRANVNARVLL